MPVLKYIFLVGASLFALILLAETMVKPEPETASDSSTSLHVLRKMAHHGEVRQFAPLASAGPFLPVPAATAQAPAPPAIVSASAVSTPSASAKPVAQGETIREKVAARADAVPTETRPSSLNAQASMAHKAAKKPLRPARKLAARKTRPHSVYVENVPQRSYGENIPQRSYVANARQSGPFGFFSALESW